MRNSSRPLSQQNRRKPKYDKNNKYTCTSMSRANFATSFVHLKRTYHFFGRTACTKGHMAQLLYGQVSVSFVSMKNSIPC